MHEKGGGGENEKEGPQISMSASPRVCCFWALKKPPKSLKPPAARALSCRAAGTRWGPLQARSGRRQLGTPFPTPPNAQDRLGRVVPKKGALNYDFSPFDAARCLGLKGVCIYESFSGHLVPEKGQKKSEASGGPFEILLEKFSKGSRFKDLARGSGPCTRSPMARGPTVFRPLG